MMGPRRGDKRQAVQDPTDIRAAAGGRFTRGRLEGLHAGGVPWWRQGEGLRVLQCTHQVRREFRGERDRWASSTNGAQGKKQTWTSSVKQPLGKSPLQLDSLACARSAKNSIKRLVSRHVWLWVLHATGSRATRTKLLTRIQNGERCRGDSTEGRW